MRAEETLGESSVMSAEEARELGLSRSGRLREFLHSHRWTGASFCAHGLMLICFSLLPPKSSALALDMLSEDARYARYLATSLERDANELKAVQELVQGAPEGGAATAGNEGAAGKPTAQPKPKRAGGGAQKSTQDAHSEARSAGILGVLAMQPTWSEANHVFDRGAGYGYLPSEALARMVGSELADSGGIHGIGMRGTGRSGGGDVEGSIAVGGLHTGQSIGPGGVGGADSLARLRRRANVPRELCCGAAEVRGSLSKDTIRRVIQRHLAEVRFCYEEALRRRPELSGRVQLAFMIAPSGAVQQAKVADSSLGSPEAESCIARAAQRWAFPAPDGGGYVAVRYPFMLEQAEN
jgi:TonB family protein